MAIKGKRKPKARSGRVVTAGPRPAYVAPKVPPLQKTGAKFLVALIFEAIIFSLLIGFGEQSQADRQEEAINEFTTLTQTALGRAGQAIVPLPGGATVLANLPTRLSELKGEIPEAPPKEDVIAEAELWSSSLVDAADAVSVVQVPSESLDPEQRLALTEARNLMSRGLRIFAGLADQLLVAVEIQGQPQQDLIAAMEAQIPVATETFSAGYGRLTSVRQQAGLSTTGTIPAGGLPAPPQVVPGFDPTMPVGEVPVEGDAGGGDAGGNKGGGGGNG